MQQAAVVASGRAAAALEALADEQSGRLPHLAERRRFGKRGRGEAVDHVMKRN